jgi:hypothetical protein
MDPVLNVLGGEILMEGDVIIYVIPDGPQLSIL